MKDQGESDMSGHFQSPKGSCAVVRIGLHMCTYKYTRRLIMETLKVGIREFREKLASYLLETEVPVAITRHGDTIGYYIPARRKRSEAERTALKEAAVRLQKVLTAEGISEEEILNDFKQWRVGGRK
jgi:PHD/YefM family antitoxin component YafN of YafNO toxin-antitoxin module